VGRLDIEGVVQPQPGYLEPGNRALSLDGAGDFMSIRPPALALDPGRSDAAVELWLAAEKLPVAGGDGQVVLGAGAVGEATPFALRIRASGATATLYAPAWRQGQDDVAVGPVEEFVPVHVALVFRNGFLMAYWNGKLAGTAERADGQGASAGGLLVGAAMGPGGEPAEFLKGQVDELRVWRRALSREEIRAHMGGGLAGVEPDLAAYWSFDDLSGDGGVPDLSGQGLDGVLVGDAHVAPWPARR
jgi:hypothetical protein